MKVWSGFKINLITSVKRNESWLYNQYKAEWKTSLKPVSSRMKVVYKQVWSGFKIDLMTSVRRNENRLYNQWEAN